MPRNGRGGARSGKPGVAYPQRSDLNGPPSNVQPIRVAPGQGYGVATQQADAQRAIPLPAQPPVAAPPAAAPTPVVPGTLGDFHRPTERPAEPLTNGLAVGPGAGPEALNPTPDANKLSAMLSQLAHTSGSSDLAFLAQQAQALDQ